MEVGVTEERSLPGGCQSQQWSQSDTAITLLYQLLEEITICFSGYRGEKKEKKEKDTAMSRGLYFKQCLMPVREHWNGVWWWWCKFWTRSKYPELTKCAGKSGMVPMTLEIFPFYSWDQSWMVAWDMGGVALAHLSYGFPLLFFPQNTLREACCCNWELLGLLGSLGACCPPLSVPILHRWLHLGLCVMSPSPANIPGPRVLLCMQQRQNSFIHSGRWWIVCQCLYSRHKPNFQVLVD